MIQIENLNSIQFPFPGSSVDAKKTGQAEEKKDSIEISDSTKAFAAVEKTLDLSSLHSIDLSGLSEQEKEEYGKMLSSLMKKGIAGYEVLNVNGEPEKHFLETEIGDERIKGAKLYRRKE